MANYVNGVVDTALKIHDTEEPGDILAFLTGLDEVDRAVSLLSEHAKLIKDGKREWAICFSLVLDFFPGVLAQFRNARARSAEEDFRFPRVALATR